jgi:hypothetical protein
MRLFCELFLVAVLIWLGWSQSFHDRFDRIRGVEPAANVTSKTQASQTAVAAAAPAPAPRQPFLRARPAPTPSGDWMWDPAHRNPLDRSSYKSGDSSVQEAAQRSSQNYWIDARGVRHYSTGAPPPPGASP